MAIPRFDTVRPLAERYGRRRGIQFSENSSGIDVSLMLLFFSHDTFDETFAQLPNEHREVLNKILHALRCQPYFCTEESVSALRKRFGARESRGLIDIGNLMEKMMGPSFLNAQPFLSYGNGTQEFIHSIFVSGSTRHGADTLVQSLLNRSLESQDLEFQSAPRPALVLKMPFSNGSLAGVDYVIPNLELQVPYQYQDGASGVEYYGLVGVATLESDHFVAYLRVVEKNRETMWLRTFADSKSDPPAVERCFDLEEELSQAVRSPETARQLTMRSSHLHKILTQTVLCIYARGKVSGGVNQSADITVKAAPSTFTLTHTVNSTEGQVSNGDEAPPKGTVKSLLARFERLNSQS